jgi:hypothetical protein
MINYMEIYLKLMPMEIFSRLFMGLNFFLGRICFYRTDYFIFIFSLEVREIYPNKYITVDDRIYVFYTLFNLPGNEE